MAFWDFFKRSRPVPKRHNRGPFIAASVDRLTASWVTTQQAINDELRGDLDRLRLRARDLAKNNEYARKFLRMVARNIVGPQGFIYQARIEDAPGRPDRLANNAMEAAFYRWSRRGSAEITGRMSFEDVQRVVAMTVARDGEALVRFVRGRDAGNPEGFALQILDTARLDTQMNREAKGGNNAVVMGVEISSYGRPVAYWIKDKVNGTQSQRVDAADILHVFLPEHAEQVRGIPWMHAAMIALHDLGEFNRAALLAARKGAETLGFIVSPDGTGAGFADQVEPEPLKISAPGTYDVLPEGYDIKTPDYSYPNEVFDPFVRSILRRISSGFDVAYNSLANDLESVSYSSIRAGVLEERDQWMTLQNWFTEAFLEPVFAEWFPRALTAGVVVLPNGESLPVSKAEKFQVHEWQGRRWAWVDPLKDQEAAVLAIEKGLMSPQQVAAEQGLDLEDVINAIAAANAMAEAAGLPTYSSPIKKTPSQTSTENKPAT
jgi:lambda family phage portal protein